MLKKLFIKLGLLKDPKKVIEQILKELDETPIEYVKVTPAKKKPIKKAAAKKPAPKKKPATKKAK